MNPYQYEGDGTGEQNSVGLLTVWNYEDIEVGGLRYGQIVMFVLSPYLWLS